MGKLCVDVARAQTVVSSTALRRHQRSRRPLNSGKIDLANVRGSLERLQKRPKGRQPRRRRLPRHNQGHARAPPSTMQGLGPGSLLGAAREAAYGEISAEARQLGKAEIVGMDTWEHEGADESKMTPRERARYRARKGRRFLREADEARSPEQKASLKTDFRRQLGPSVPSIDPYGSYHLPLQYDTDRLPYGARPADDEPHIVLEYRELIPKLDKHCVRLFAEGGGKRYLEECRKTEEQVQAERLLLDADLSEREAIEIRDEAALAEAVAQAAMTQLDSENYSEALKKRLEDERGKIQDASRHDYTDIYRWDPDGIPLEEVDSDDGWDIDIEMNNANISCDLGVLRSCGAFTSLKRVVSGRAGGGWSLFRFRGRSRCSTQENI